MHINSNRGFSLIEVLISIAIIGMLSGLVIYSYGNSNDKLALSSAGQELAIVMRQAQAYGLSVKESGTATGSFAAAYGIYFSPSGSPNDYYLFVDRNSNNVYDNAHDAGSGCGSASTECVEKFTFRNNITITRICDSVSCPPSGATRLNILFRRPSSDARVYFANNSNTIVSGPSSRGRVTLTSAKSRTLEVTAESTGQILVQ